MNTNITLIKNQASKEKEVKDLLKHINSLTKAQRAILNNTIKQCFKYRRNSPAQQSVAKWLGYSRATANRSFKVLHDAGLIHKETRHRDTCIYTLNPLLNHPVIRSELRHVLPALLLPFLLVCHFASAASIDKNVTPPEVKINKFIYSSNQLTKRIASRLQTSLQNGWSELLKKIVRGEAPIMDMIPIAAKNFRSLALTLRGQIELAPYPDEVIRKADIALCKTQVPVENPMPYLRKICQRICNDLKVIPQWHLISALLQHYGLPVSEPCLKQPGINKEPMVIYGENPQISTQPKKKNSHKQESRRLPAWRQEPPVRYPPTEFAKRVLPEGTKKISPEELMKMLGIATVDKLSTTEI